MRQKKSFQKTYVYDQNAQTAEEKASPWFHARPVAAAALGLLVGLLIGDGFSLLRAMIACAVLLVCALAARILKKVMWTVFLVFMALGFVRVALAAPTAVPTGTGVVQGRICETPEARDFGQYRVYLDDATLDGKPISGRLRLFTRFSGEPAYGQVVSASAEVVASAEKYRLNDRYRSVFAVAFARGETKIPWQSPPDLYGALLELRETIATRIALLFPNAPAKRRA